MFSILTLNLLDDLFLWERRAPLILEAFQEFRPDVIALQEVSLDPNNAEWLAHRIHGYSAYICPRTHDSQSDSLAVLTRDPVESHDVLNLGVQGRQAQRVRVSAEGRVWTVVNTHLAWNPVNDAVRRKQAALILDWVAEDERLVLCGDMNAMPSSGTMGLLKGRLLSAHEAAHGSEPAYTYPTHLARGPGLRHWSRHGVLRLNGIIRRRRYIRWAGTIDYIMVDPALQVKSCEVILDKPSPQDSRLYGSDHFGLLASMDDGTSS